jgi:Ca-activated chloride channel family protein
MFFMGVGFALILCAAARPRWGVISEQVFTTDRNVVVAIDVSRSMLAGDVRPNRLERAKSDVADLIDSLEGDRCALVAFRRTGVALCPLTADYGFLRSALEAASIDSAPKGETDLGSAIRESLQVISQVDGKEGAKANRSAIILISDGGDLRGDAIKESEKSKDRGVPIFTIGIGDPGKGSPIPDENGNDLKFKGEVVTTKLEEDALKKIADTSGGRYVSLATSGTVKMSFGDLYRKLLSQVEGDMQKERNDVLNERYVWFLVPGLVFLLAGAMLSKGRLNNRKNKL